MREASQDVVPLASPAAENARLRPRLIEAAARVIDGGSYVLGPEVAAFEGELARQVGAAGAVGVGSGTDALALALQAVGVGEGSEVVIPSHTAGPTAAAVRMLKAVPVLVDVSPETYALTPRGVAAAVTERTKAVIVVHLYGCPADVEGLLAVTRPAGLALIEDCAQAQGASLGGRPVGSFGDLGCFSFYPTKNLGAVGDGGAVAGSDPALLAKVRALRAYGWLKPQYAELADGRCSRLDELQAAMLRVKLEGLAEAVARRGEVARRYVEGLSGLPLALPRAPEGAVHGWHLFVVRTPKRDALAAHLKARGIMTGLHYPFAVHRQPAFAAVSRLGGPLTQTDALVPEILSLPMFPELSDAQVARVIDAVRSFFA